MQTDKAGRLLLDLQVGEHELSVTAQGFQSVTVDIDVLEPGIVELQTFPVVLRAESAHP